MTLPSLPLPLEAVAGMKLPAAVAAKMEENAGTNNSEEDEEEEEIDDDEEMSLKIDESARA